MLVLVEFWAFDFLDRVAHGYTATQTSAGGRICVSRISPTGHSARCLRSPEGTRHHRASALKKTRCSGCGTSRYGWYERKRRRVRDLSCGDMRVYLEIEFRRVECRHCGKVRSERLDFLADNPFYTKRFALYVGRRWRDADITAIAKELHLDWRAVKELEKQSMRALLARVGTPARIVVSDLERRRPIWFGGEDRKQASMAEFCSWLGPAKAKRLRLAVMDMWKPFRNATKAHAPQAAILFDKFHVLRHLGEALDKVRRSEYARLTGKDRGFVKGQKYTLLAHRQNLSLQGRQALRRLLCANKRLNTAYVLKESFGQLWDYQHEGWARRFFENWRAALKWQRLKPYEEFAAMIERHWDGIAAYCQPENKVSLGFVEGLNNKIRVIQRRAYGIRDEEYLRLKILTSTLSDP